MKLSDYKNEDALDLLADLLEPVAEIAADTEVVEAFKGKTKLEAIKIAIKKHKKEVVEILARIENTPVEEYSFNVFTLPLKVLEILNDKDLLDFFAMQGQIVGENVSGSAMGNTKADEK